MSGRLSRQSALAPFLAAVWFATAFGQTETTSPPVQAYVADLGLRPKVYPHYLGKGRGWQDLYNQDETGAYYLEREFRFCNVRLDLRITQAYIGNESRPVGRLGVRFPASAHLVTGTQPQWVSTWCKYDEKFPGMLDVFVGEKGLRGVPPEFESGSLGPIAFLRARWFHEKAAVAATFLMLPDDDRLFCEVGVRPRTSGLPVRVSLCCWPGGKFEFQTASTKSPALRYDMSYSLPARDHTVVFGDPSFDPAGRLPWGVCALTYSPEECQSAQVKRTFPLFVTLNLRATHQTNAVYTHFVLWELLHRRGALAFSYVTRREADTLVQFDSMKGIDAPRLRARRERGLREARRRLRALDAALRTMPPPEQTRPPAAAPSPLSERALNLRWMAFYRSRADAYLASGNWRAALRAIARVEGALKTTRTPAREPGSGR